MDEEQLIERYLERVAIQEFDGGLSRLEATKQNFARLEKWCERNGKTVPQVLRDDLESVEREHSERDSKQEIAAA